MNGLVTEVAPEALRHFPDYEPIDAAPDAVFVEPASPPTEAVEIPKTTRRSTAAKNDEE
ncbi:hypothetical protein ACFXJ8_26005 [Nonomuraea sp. NPDC059194]|uniref:hypothetical protein n=1 Tax=Nonomuraea sp. NPDC059194 TaxID=3346764 RepID=UPI0036A455D2